MNTLLGALLSVFLLVGNSGAYFDGDLADDQVLLVLSLDAFKPEYLDYGLTENMELFRQMGSYSPFMIPRFPTKTFVNHFSLATGCNAGSHGVTANELYDSELGKLKYSYDLFHYNLSCVPIWTINQRNEKHSGCMMWPGSDFPYGGRYCTHYQKLDEKMSWLERTQMVISWIKDKRRPANLIMWYMEQPDSEGHAFSPSSEQERNMISQLDCFVGELERQIQRNGLADRVNIIILSDHGMTTVSIDDIIDMRKILREGIWESYGTSPVIQVIPQAGYEDEVWTTLSNAAQDKPFNVYTNDNVPPRWKVNNERRLGPILAVADPPYAFEDLLELADWFRTTRDIPVTLQSKYGVHGYDNEVEDMRAIFMAKGPMFKSGQILTPFDNIDTFPLFCILLDITCPPSEGSERLETWNMLLRTGLEGPSLPSKK